MKKSINAWSADPSVSREELFRDVKAAGFEGIELNVDGPNGAKHALSMETTGEELAQIRQLSQKYSLPVGSISTSLWWKVSMGDPIKTDAAAALLEQQLRCAKETGATAILVVPGGMSSDRTLKQAWDNSVTFLKGQKETIERYGIIVGVENVWNEFFTSPFDMCCFLDEVNHPLVQAYYDVGNVIAFSTSEHWIEILGNRICKIHIKDFKRNKGKINTGGNFVDLTQGDVNWKTVVPALRKAGYDGFLTAEVFKEDETQPYTEYYRQISAQEDEILSY